MIVETDSQENFDRGSHKYEINSESEHSFDVCKNLLFEMISTISEREPLSTRNEVPHVKEQLSPIPTQPSFELFTKDLDRCKSHCSSRHSTTSSVCSSLDNLDSDFEHSNEESDANSDDPSEAIEYSQKYRRGTSFDNRQEELLAWKENMRSYGDSMEHVISQWRRLKEDVNKMGVNSVLNTDDSDSLIQRRISEIGNMCSSTSRANFYVSTLSKECQNAVKAYKQMSPNEFRIFRRKFWSIADHVRYAFRMAFLLSRACYGRRKLNDSYTKKSMSDRDAAVCSIARSLRDSLLVNPEYRTIEDKMKILRYLRSSKAFSHIFSSEMEEECSKYVSYEKYQDSRIMAYQNVVPDRFYYVISGKIEKVQVYELRHGNVQRSFGFMDRGETSDVELLGDLKPRKYMLISKGTTELLVLDKARFLALAKGADGPPLDFLRTIDIFCEFPCEVFSKHPDSIITQYFPKDKVIIRDIADTAWIYVIKTGSAMVVRYQTLISQSKNKYLQQRKMGYVKSGSHSRAMLGLPDRQRNARSVQNFKLPRLSAGENPLSHTIGVRERDNLVSYKTTSSSDTLATDSYHQEEDQSFKVHSKNNKKSMIWLTDISIPLTTDSFSKEAFSVHKDRQYLSKVLLGPSYQKKKRPLREAFVILDTVRSKDLIGLQNILSFREETSVRKVRKTSKGDELALLSCGAEIVLINKRIFIQYAANNTMLKLQTLNRQYANVDEAMSWLETKESWNHYRMALMRTVFHRNCNTAR